LVQLRRDAVRIPDGAESVRREVRRDHAGQAGPGAAAPGGDGLRHSRGSRSAVSRAPAAGPQAPAGRRGDPSEARRTASAVGIALLADRDPGPVRGAATPSRGASERIPEIGAGTRGYGRPPRRIGNGQERARPPLSRHAPRETTRGDPGRTLLRERVRPLQGARQPDGQLEQSPQAAAARARRVPHAEGRPALARLFPVLRRVEGRGGRARHRVLRSGTSRSCGVEPSALFGSSRRGSRKRVPSSSSSTTCTGETWTARRCSRS
jgi:hypothetical protein